MKMHFDNHAVHPEVKKLKELEAGETFYTRMGNKNFCYMLIDTSKANIGLKDGDLGCVCLDTKNFVVFSEDTDVNLISIHTTIFPFIHTANENSRCYLYAPNIIDESYLIDGKFILLKTAESRPAELFMKMGVFLVNMQTGELIKYKFKKGADIYEVLVVFNAVIPSAEDDDNSDDADETYYTNLKHKLLNDININVDDVYNRHS